MKTMTIICSNVLPTRTAFGVCTDSGDHVFVPARLSEAADLRGGDKVVVDVVPNTRNPENTPWMAARIVGTADAQRVDAPPAESIEDSIMQVFDNTSYASTSEIAATVGVSSAEVSGIVQRMFRMGQLTKAAVYASASQVKPSFLLWAPNVDRFLEAGDE